MWIALDDEASRRSACFVQNFSSCQCARSVAGVRLDVGQATGAGCMRGLPTLDCMARVSTWKSSCCLRLDGRESRTTEA